MTVVDCAVRPFTDISNQREETIDEKERIGRNQKVLALVALEMNRCFENMADTIL